MFFIYVTTFVFSVAGRTKINILSDFSKKTVTVNGNFEHSAGTGTGGSIRTGRKSEKYQMEKLW